MVDESGDGEWQVKEEQECAVVVRNSVETQSTPSFIHQWTFDKVLNEIARLWDRKMCSHHSKLTRHGSFDASVNQ